MQIKKKIKAIDLILHDEQNHPEINKLISKSSTYVEIGYFVIFIETKEEKLFVMKHPEYFENV